MDDTELTEEQSVPQRRGRCVFLLTSPRTASNLFMKMLNVGRKINTPAEAPNEDVLRSGYFYGAPMDFQDDNYDVGTPFEELSGEAKEKTRAAYQDATDHFVDIAVWAEREIKTVVFKEHIVNMIKPALQAEMLHGTPASGITPPWTISVDGYDDSVSLSNPLFLPDRWLHMFIPTILIRHPAVAFPSEYRAEVVARQAFNTHMRDPYSSLVSSNTAVRHLYDFYRSYFIDLDSSSPWPLVIDAADLIANPEPYMNQFCELTGIDASRLRYNWQPLSEGEIEALGNDGVRRFLSTLSESNGVRKEKANRTVDVDAEMASFRAEFGDEVAQKMDIWIRRAVVDYEYLHSQRWIPTGRSSTTSDECTSTDAK